MIAEHYLVRCHVRVVEPYLQIFHSSAILSHHVCAGSSCSLISAILSTHRRHWPKTSYSEIGK